jgi:CRP-like cAMP-binding protein
LEHAALEESMKDALLQAGERLAEAVRAGLLAQGLPSDVCLVVEDGRVMVVSRSGAVRQAELGSAGSLPRGGMAAAAHAAAGHVVRKLAQDLEGFVK